MPRRAPEGTLAVHETAAEHTTMRPSLAIALSAILLAACTAVPPAAPSGAQPSPTAVAAGGAPTVEVDPLATDLLAIGQPVTLTVHASDAAGVARIELRAGDVIVDTVTAPDPAGVPQLDAQLTWTPTAAGPGALVVLAYRADGTPSAPVTLAVSVTAPATASPSSLPGLTPGTTALPTDPTAVVTPSPEPTVNPTPRRTRQPTARPTRRPTAPPTATPTVRPAVANLRIYSVNVYNTGNPGERSVYVELENAGRAAAGPFIVAISYTRSGGGGGAFKAEEFPNGLGPNSGIQVIRTATFEPGTYTFTATADAANQVVESKEGDNTKTATEVVE